MLRGTPLCTKVSADTTAKLENASSNLVVMISTSEFAAAANGHVDCLRILKEHNINFTQNQSGNTPFRKLTDSAGIIVHLSFSFRIRLGRSEFKA